nr:hypothetical protein GCM10020092_001080 [Actinoplanes digitatis]
MDRTDCSARPAHHHRPARLRRGKCDDPARRARRSQHRAGRDRTIKVHIEPADGDGRRVTIAAVPERVLDAVRDRPEPAGKTVTIRVAKPAPGPTPAGGQQ